MIPVTIFDTAEGMYKGLRELLASHPEYKRYDNERWRVIEIPPQQFPPVNPQAVFILMEYCDIDVWEEHERWLTVASDGEHPDGYKTFEEAMQALRVEMLKRLPYTITIDDDDFYGLLNLWDNLMSSADRGTSREFIAALAFLLRERHSLQPNGVYATLRERLVQNIDTEEFQNTLHIFLADLAEYSIQTT
jgi:hypothetical protein